MEDKERIRKQIKYILTTTSKDYFNKASSKITIKAKSLVKKLLAKKIGVYVSLPKEVQTESLIQSFFDSNLEVSVPRCKENSLMDFVRIRSFDELVPGTYGIKEPLDSLEITNIDDLDALIIPCVSASSSGARLGHGKGYYDIALQNYHKPKICLCFDKCLLETIPQDKKDVLMDYIVTEEEIIKVAK